MLNPNELQRRLRQGGFPGATPAAAPTVAPAAPRTATGLPNRNLQADLQRLQPTPRPPVGGGVSASAAAPARPAPASPAPAASAAAARPEPPSFSERFQERIDPNAPMGSSRQMQGALRQMNQQLARYAFPQLLQGLDWLNEQANMDQFSPEGRAAFLARPMEELSDFENRAQTDIARSMAARGLDNSSYGAALEGTLAAQGASNRAAMVQRLYDAEQQRQAQMQSLRNAFASSLFNSGTQNASSIWNQLAQLQLARDQMKQQSGFDLGSLIRAGMQFLPGAGGTGGAAAGGSSPGTGPTFNY